MRPEMCGKCVQIPQGHGDHFPGAQPETRQEQQDRIIPLAYRCAAIAAFEQLLNLFGRERLGQV